MHSSMEGPHGSKTILIIIVAVLLVLVGTGSYVLGTNKNKASVDFLTKALQCKTDNDCQDDNVCTDDICTKGVCSNPNSIEGKSCGANLPDVGTTNFCDGAGKCVYRGTIQPGSSEDAETASWKTYNDTKLKFTIKYPSDVAISRTLPEGGVEFSLASELEKDFRERSIKLDIYYRGNKNITPEEAQQSECSKPCTDVAEKTTINNASGVKVVSTNSERYYLASTNSNVVGIFLVFFPDTTSKSVQTDLEKFRQTLSAFKFTQ